MKKLLLLALALLLTGCQSFTARDEYMADGKPLGNHYLPWPQRQKQLQGLTSWTANGSIAARNQIKGGWNASFNWRQHYQTYNVALFGPLGTNHVQINGNPSQVTLTTSRQTLTARTPEALIQQQLGWQLPVSNLPYWLRGLPAPYTRNKHAVDMNDHIVHMYQDGWNIYYLRYIVVDGVDIPDRILLSNPPWVVHVVVHQWSY